MVVLGLSPGSKDQNSPAFPAKNQVSTKNLNLLLRSSAGLQYPQPSLSEKPCPCATPGSPPASWAGRGSTTARRRSHLCRSRSRCRGPRSRPSCFSRTGRSAVAGRPWFPRVLLVQNSGRSPACLPFPRSTAGGFEARRGSRARRAGPLRFRKAARWLGRRFRHCAPRHRLGAAQKPGPRADRESMVRWRPPAPLGA